MSKMGRRIACLRNSPCSSAPAHGGGGKMSAVGKCICVVPTQLSGSMGVVLNSSHAIGIGHLDACLREIEQTTNIESVRKFKCRRCHVYL